MRKGPVMMARTLVAALLLACLSFAALTGCESRKLVDQDDGQMSAIVESIQADFAEDGWVYTGFEVVETDEENDTATVAISYDVVGDAKELLEEHASAAPDDDAVYDLASDINVKVTVELSAYDKDNDAFGCSLTSTQWFVGDTEASQWIETQGKG